jgi:thiol:disulfide interchange protein
MPINKGIFFIAGLALLLLPFCNQPSGGEIGWIDQNYDVALAKAETDDKLIMIDVYTDWCAPCKKMDKETFPAEEVVNRAANFVNLKLDAEKGQGPEVQRKFGVTAYPTILFVNGKGELVHTVVGLQSAQQLAAEMDKALDKVS